MGEDWDEGFYGTPFEALGNINDAIYEAGASALVDRIGEFIRESQIIRDRTLQEGTLYSAVLLYPGSGAANLGILVSYADTDAQLAVVSLYPVLEGLPCELEVVNFKAWENGLEGMVAVDTGQLGLLAFFDPFYCTDHWRLKIGETFTFMLSALALSVEIAKNEEIEITEGPLYETNLENFLREHPDRTREDFPNPVVIMGSAQMLLPTRYTGEYEYRALVLAREKVPFLESGLWRYHISLLIDEDAGAPELWLYASPHVIKGNEPRVGDYIEGVCWTNAYLPA